MNRLLLILLSLAFSLAAVSQTTVNGIVVDDSGNPVDAATVTLLRGGNPLRFCHSAPDGKFVMSVDSIQETDSINVTCLGYARRRVGVSPDGFTTVVLQPETFELKEVTVRGNRVIGRADTTVYDLSRFTSPRDNSLKDVLRKLPGVDIDDNGEVSVNGKRISRFTIEGLDMTGGRYNQLEENIKARDVKKAEVIDHDQPVKALQDKVFTDDVAMNIVMKDSVRDKLFLTLKPYVLCGETNSLGGEVDALQIGRSRQFDYKIAYDRTGRDLSGQNAVRATWRAGLASATIPSWLAVPSLSAPIDADRLRFNTSQNYSANRIQKHGDCEQRLSAHYLRTVERQHTSNESSYDLGGASPVNTSQRQLLDLTNDDLSLEADRKVNAQSVYGSGSLTVSAHRTDALSYIGDSITQRISAPKVNVTASLYRLYTVGKSQWTVNAVADYHHGRNSLHVNDFQNTLRTNLWHTAASVGWLRKRTFFTHRLTAVVDAQNLNVCGNVPQIGASVVPYWQYKRVPWTVALSARARWERYPQQDKDFMLFGGRTYVNWKNGRHTELSASVDYDESTSGAGDFALTNVRRDYRTYFHTSGSIPTVKNLAAYLGYVYKRPITELFINADISAGRAWRSVTDGLEITGGNYYLSYADRPSHNTFARAESAVSKGFFALHLKTRIACSATYNKGVQMTGGDFVGYRTTVCKLSPNIEFSQLWGALSYTGDFQWLHSAGQSTLFDWRQWLSLTSTIGAVDVTYSMVHYRNELQSGTAVNTLLGDAKAVWRMKKLRLSAALTNLFDKREYAVTQYSGVGSLTDRYVLRGREFVLSAQFSL